MSQSPLTSEQSTESPALVADRQRYLDRWNDLATLIRQGNSFSGRERNCAFLNLGSTSSPRFSDVSAAWGLDLADDARGVALVDWDQDGDLDCWIANRTAPRARLMLNRLVRSPRYLALKLIGTNCNRDAIGARVTLVTGKGERRIRTVRAGEGFLSQSTKVVHFGLGSEDKIDHVTVQWPGTAKPQHLVGLTENHLYHITQAKEAPTAIAKRNAISLPANPITPVAPTEEARIVLAQRLPLPTLHGTGTPGERHPQTGVNSRGLLVNLWASWCGPCLEELQQLKQYADAFQRHGLRVVTLSVDEDPAAAEAMAARLQLPWDNGLAEAQFVSALGKVFDSVLYRLHPLPVPCSLLVDHRGQIAIIYKGPVAVSQILRDSELLDTSPGTQLAAASPFAGRQVTTWFQPTPVNLAKTYLDGDYYDDAKRVLQSQLDAADESDALAAWRIRWEIARAEGNVADQRMALDQIVKRAPEDVRAQVQSLLLGRAKIGTEGVKRRLEMLVQANGSNPDSLCVLAQAFAGFGDAARAIELLERSLLLDPHHAETLMGLAAARHAAGDVARAIDHYRVVLEHHPQRSDAKNNLAWVLATALPPHSDPRTAISLARQACEETGFTHPAYLDTLGEVLFRSGERDEARTIWQTALNLARRNADARLVNKLEASLQGC